MSELVAGLRHESRLPADVAHALNSRLNEWLTGFRQMPTDPARLLDAMGELGKMLKHAMPPYMEPTLEAVLGAMVDMKAADSHAERSIDMAGTADRLRLFVKAFVAASSETLIAEIRTEQPASPPAASHLPSDQLAPAEHSPSRPTDEPAALRYQRKTNSKPVQTAMLSVWRAIRRHLPNLLKRLLKTPVVSRRPPTWRQRLESFIDHLVEQQLIARQQAVVLTNGLNDLKRSMRTTMPSPLQNKIGLFNQRWRKEGVRCWLDETGQMRFAEQSLADVSTASTVGQMPSPPKAMPIDGSAGTK